MDLTRPPHLISRIYGKGEPIVADSRFGPAQVWFVQNLNVGGVNPSQDAVGYGKTPDKPFRSIAYTLQQCQSYKGDVVCVLPRHTESVTSANGILMDKVGVSVIGVGTGNSRPKVTFATNTTASWGVAAIDCLIENIRFETSRSSLDTMILGDSCEDLVIRNCEFGPGSAEADILIYAIDASKMIIEDSIFKSTTGPVTAVQFGSGSFTIIRNNLFLGKWGTLGAISNDGSSASIAIKGNVILNRSADDNNKTIVLDASTTGIIAGNWGSIIDSTAPAPVTAAAAFVAGNYWSSAPGVSPSTLM